MTRCDASNQRRSVLWYYYYHERTIHCYLLTNHVPCIYEELSRKNRNNQNTYACVCVYLEYIEILERDNYSCAVVMVSYSNGYCVFACVYMYKLQQACVQRMPNYNINIHIYDYIRFIHGMGMVRHCMHRVHGNIHIYFHWTRKIGIEIYLDSKCVCVYHYYWSMHFNVAWWPPYIWLYDDKSPFFIILYRIFDDIYAFYMQICVWERIQWQANDGCVLKLSLFRYLYDTWMRHEKQPFELVMISLILYFKFTKEIKKEDTHGHGMNLRKNIY